MESMMFLRIFPQGQVVLLDSHFDRIENTARVLGYSVVLERQSIRDCIKRLVYQSGYAESKLKFFLPYDNLQEVWLVLEDFANQAAALDAMKKTGVTAAVQRIQRMNPLAKTVQWGKNQDEFLKDPSRKNHTKNPDC